MKKLLVTTDISTNSIAGLQFAIQLSAQVNIQLVFLHVHDVMQEAIATSRERKKLLRKQREILLKEMERLVHDVYSSMQVQPQHFKCVLFYHFGVVSSIMEYAEKNHCTYICISTHGAGNVMRLMGTTASNLIAESRLPVFCIPKTYQATAVTSLLYTSDLQNHKQELRLVTGFAGLIGAKVGMLYLFAEREPMPADDKLKYELEKKYNYKIDVHFIKRKAGNLLQDIDDSVAAFAPSLLIMFTQENRPFFDMLFLTSKSEQYSFRTKIPMLVFNKPQKLK